jgi:PKD repeat protein
MKKSLLQFIGNNAKVAGLTILGFVSLSLSAQMTGSYTINSVNAASTTNFKDWRSFSQSLQGLSRNDLGPTLAGGVSGAVTVDVQSDITETAQITFPAITGTSSTNTIKINGNGKFISNTIAGEIISFTGADYVTIDNLIVRNTNANPIGIRFSNGSNYNSITKCTIQFSGIITGTTSLTQAYIAFAASATALGTVSTSVNGSFNTIKGNTCRTTNVNSPGPTIGIALMGNTADYTTTAHNNEISDNIIENFFFYGVISFYGNGNHLLNNDISRKNSTINNGNTTLWGLYNGYQSSTNRQVRVDGNNVHDLPFIGATETNSNATTYGYYLLAINGTSTNRATVANNTYTNVYSTGAQYGIYPVSCVSMDVNKNLISNVFQGTSTVARFYGIWVSSGQNVNITANTIRRIRCNYYLYGIYATNTTGTDMKISDNILTDWKTNTTQFHYVYCIYPSFTNNYVIERNIIDDIRMIGSGPGYVYGIYDYYQPSSKIYSNRLTRMTGYYSTYGIYPYSFTSSHLNVDVRQNTVAIDGASSTYFYHYGYPIYCYYYYANNINVVGNILSTEGGYGAYPAYQASQSSNFSNFNWNHNTYWYKNVSYTYWYNVSGGGNLFSNWMGTFLPGSGERFEDPLFKNPSAADYRSDNFFCQNNVPTVAQNPIDVTGANRNIVSSDRGCVESFMDIQAVSTNFTVPATVCAGYTAGSGTTLTVRNLFVTDTAYDFNVAYAVNGKNKQSVKVTSKLLFNGTATVTFPNSIQLNEVGNNRIAVFIDIPDDNRANDSFIFNTVVKAAPGGSKWNFSATPSQTIYQTGKKNDVTVVNEKAIYDINPPRAYGNTDYGVKWTATAYATSASGAAVTGASISKNPTGSNNMEYTFTTSNVNLEDSMITMYLKVSDLTNGCDTIIKRDLLIYPTINPNFTFPTKICNGDDVEFNNTSTVRSGNMEFEWDFGTGNPADISTAPNPIFQFPGTGNYTVKMTAKTLPYGFTVTKTQTVNVSPIPTVAFTKQNACEGQNLTFTNKTVPANSTYTWAFGDGSFSTATNPTKMYATTGQYTVTLKANLNGCIGELSQRVYQFDKPKADFALVSGTCDNEKFVFDNKSTIKDGLYGNMWDFNDGNVSTEDEPVHAFASFGKKQVKLTTTSEFGCVDSKTVEVTVNESPKTDFTHDPACSLTPTTFTNTTPAASSNVKSFNWNFGDGGTATAESPVHSWTALGPKTVTYTIELLNGCKATATKELSVGVQPNVVFSAENVCAGDPVVFENNSSWAQGDIAFNWNFGDNTSSTNSDPQHVYTTNVTKTYNVTLKASIAGGCEATLTKPVTVNQGPTTCDFANTADYGFGFYGMKFDPMDAGGNQKTEAGVTYTWVFDGGGTQKGGTTSYNFQEDGSYTVTMRARVDATGCECTVTKKVVMNRTNAKDLEATGMTVFPNPNNGNFNIALTETFGSDVTVEVLSMTGAVMSSSTVSNTGLIAIESSNLSDGVYMVRVRSGNNVATRNITVRH